MTPSRCSSCRAEILWAETTKGARMPLDATPSANGTVRVVGDVAVVLTAAQASVRRADDVLYLPHWVSCPSADKHRNRSR